MKNVHTQMIQRLHDIVTGKRTACHCAKCGEEFPHWCDLLHKKGEPHEQSLCGDCAGENCEHESTHNLACDTCGADWS